MKIFDPDKVDWVIIILGIPALLYFMFERGAFQ
jgi:hypothetical protein